MYLKLREWRLLNSISVDELCKIIGITDESNYYRREQGETDFKLEEAKRISAHFGVPMDDLFEVA